MKLHYIRHSEVYNPEEVIYERLSGFGLSDRGFEGAKITAKYLKKNLRNPVALYASPLLRTQQTANEIAKEIGAEIKTDSRLIEMGIYFRGKKKSLSLLFTKDFHRLLNPFVPSWGEPYVTQRNRMLATLKDALDSFPADSDVLFVSHQGPIDVLKRTLENKPLFLRKPLVKDSALCSVNSFEFDKHKNLISMSYAEPAMSVLKNNTNI
jgi:broad specificity phosphatase PhoE